jgi:glycosyltransferase involved in cell wall biosynthesis
MRGGEKVLEQLCILYPDAPVYTLFHLKGTVSSLIESHPIIPSFLQRAPFLPGHYRNYLPLFPAAIESFNLQDFDLIISSSHCVAKGIVSSSISRHICYCHTPMRYIWSHAWDYFGNGRAGFLKRKTLPVVTTYLRMWDISSSNRVDRFVANSHFVEGRIRKYYGRDSSVVYPPVDTDYFVPCNRPRQDYYLIVSALVPYKRIEVAIEAFRRSGKTLIVVGTGPEEKALKRQSGGASNIQFLGRVPEAKLRQLYQEARMLIQPGVEDFGINVVEAIACGCPVVAYGRGGSTETVMEGVSGFFYNELTPENLMETVDKAGGFQFNTAEIRETAREYSPARFRSEFETLVQGTLSSGRSW